MNIAWQKMAVISAYPDLAASPFSALNVGWDSQAFDVGGAWIFKFPKHAKAEARLRNEVRFLEIIRPRVCMPVPDIRLQEGPPVFSAHRKLMGGYLLAEQYAGLSEAQRDSAAEKLAKFYAELHGIGADTMSEAGALPQPSWLRPDGICDKALPHLPAGIHGWARAALKEWEEMQADPHGAVFGHFDGHGWNMAFDAELGILNGIYDFADSGIGPLHQDFIYSSFIDEDLTLRIIAAYERITCKSIDRRRVDILTAAHRLHELAEIAHDPPQIPHARSNVEAWASRSQP